MKTLSDRTREVDDTLVAQDRLIEFLRYVTPIDTASAWHAFEGSNFEREPRFTLPPVSANTAASRELLLATPVSEVENPPLARIFSEHRDELVRKLRMLEVRGTPDFLRESIEVYGGTDPALLMAAEQLLGELAPKDELATEEDIGAAAFARIAEDEIARCRELGRGFDVGVDLCPDALGVLVSQGRLRIGSGVRVPRHRVEALLAHEIGTHIVTYANGRAQPLQLFSSGLAGYDELQEGLASFAEYLVGGLGQNRLRQLAARVVAVHHMLDGAGFVDIFRRVHFAWGIDAHTAFLVATRVSRGGGLTKDAIYLRGLLSLLGFLQAGGDFERLFLGKFSLEQEPLVGELLEEGVLRPAAVRPRYLDDPGCIARLRRARSGLSIGDLASD